MDWRPAGDNRLQPKTTPAIDQVQFRPAPTSPYAQDARPQPLPAALQGVEPVQFPPFQPPPPRKVPQPLPDNVTPVAAQPGLRTRAAEEEYEFSVRTTLPGLDALTQRQSEEELFETMRQEARRKPGAGRIYFPDEEPVSNQPFTGRQFAHTVRFVEPVYVCHKPLWFEQKNTERYGWDFGPATPAINLGMFYYDIVMLPYHVGSTTCHCFDCNAGKCLPGDPTPLLLYCERFSITGLVFEAGTILGGAFAIP